MINRLFQRAGIVGFKGHDLRRTFATLVTANSGDDFLAMRLLRDNVPGLSNRYIRYPMEHLVEALQKYSPLRQAGEESTLRPDEAGENDFRSNDKPSPVSKTEKGSKTMEIEPSKGLVETGEARSLPRTRYIGMSFHRDTVLVGQI